MIRWKIVALLLFVCMSVVGCGGQPTQATMPDEAILQGAGATFPAPLYKKWVSQYQQEHPDRPVSYDVVGSGEGVKRFLSGSVDFGASDAAMNDEEIAQAPHGVVMIPVTAGSIVLAYNLPGVKEPVKLRRDVYTDIFLGAIQTWNDPRIVADNPQLSAVKLKIAVVARQDSSGTTFAFTNHLAAVSDRWRKEGPSVGKAIDWPGSTMLAPGNEGVAARIRQVEGAIGYVQFGIARELGLAMAWLENKEGNFVQPSSSAGLATLMAAELPEDLRLFLPDPDGPHSYPIVTFSWLLLPKQTSDAQQAERLKHFVRWCLNEGQGHSELHGYLRLAPENVAAAQQALEQVTSP